MNAATTDFAGYTAQVQDDPTYYGSECTEQDGREIAERLSRMICREFPGIEVRTWRDGDGSASTTGPDSETCQEIDRWISENWTAAL